MSTATLTPEASAARLALLKAWRAGNSQRVKIVPKINGAPGVSRRQNQERLFRAGPVSPAPGPSHRRQCQGGSQMVGVVLRHHIPPAVSPAEGDHPPAPSSGEQGAWPVTAVDVAILMAAGAGLLLLVLVLVLAVAGGLRRHGQLPGAAQPGVAAPPARASLPVRVPASAPGQLQAKPTAGTHRHRQPGSVGTAIAFLLALAAFAGLMAGLTAVFAAAFPVAMPGLAVVLLLLAWNRRGSSHRRR